MAACRISLYRMVSDNELGLSLPLTMACTNLAGTHSTSPAAWISQYTAACTGCLPISHGERPVRHPGTNPRSAMHQRTTRPASRARVGDAAWPSSRGRLAQNRHPPHPPRRAAWAIPVELGDQLGNRQRRTLPVRRACSRSAPRPAIAYPLATGPLPTCETQTRPDRVCPAIAGHHPSTELACAPLTAPGPPHAGMAATTSHAVQRRQRSRFTTQISKAQGPVTIVTGLWDRRPAGPGGGRTAPRLGSPSPASSAPTTDAGACQRRSSEPDARQPP